MISPAVVDNPFQIAAWLDRLHPARRHRFDRIVAVGMFECSGPDHRADAQADTCSVKQRTADEKFFVRRHVE